ncbi:hypothetical protein [Streptomyces sp. NPDC000405]
MPSARALAGRPKRDLVRGSPAEGLGNPANPRTRVFLSRFP